MNVETAPSFLAFSCRLASTTLVWSGLLLALHGSLSSDIAHADELVALGGISKGDSAEGDGSSPVWQLDYRLPFTQRFSASFSYLNEGHIPGHHRDGSALQLWISQPVYKQQLILSAGMGPYWYYDTIAAGSSTYKNKHGFGSVFSLAATVQITSPWLFQIRSNWVTTFGEMDAFSTLAGIGYQLDGHKKSKQDTAQTSRDAKHNEVTLFVGQTITNSFESEKSVAVSIEYRRGVLPYLDWTATWLYEGDNRLIRRHGIASQLWLTKEFFDGMTSLGVGCGAYLAADHRAGHNWGDDRIVSAIGTLTGSYRLHPDWSARISWSRIATDYDRDTDVLLAGVGYRF